MGTRGVAAGPEPVGLTGFGQPAELRGLLRLGRELLQAGHTDQAADALLNTVVTLYGFPRALLVSAQNDRLTVLGGHGLLRRRPAGFRDSRAVSRAVATSTVLMLRRLEHVEEPWLTQLLPEGVAVLIVPMTGPDGPQGALVVQMPVLREDGWRSGVVDPLEQATASTAAALHTLARVEHLQRMATTDGLTMIANRLGFTTLLERELARSLRTDRPVSLVMVDLDHFAEINDLYGHRAGDDALCNVAEALSRTCRDLDTTARYGGEEFVVVLPDCGPDRSVAVAERLRAAVASAQASEPLTASAGVASFPAHASDVDSLVLAADTALLVSKAEGRDRVTRAVADARA